MIQLFFCLKNIESTMNRNKIQFFYFFWLSTKSIFKLLTIFHQYCQLNFAHYQNLLPFLLSKLSHFNQIITLKNVLNLKILFFFF